MQLCICHPKSNFWKEKHSLFSWQLFPLDTKDSLTHKLKSLEQVAASGESPHILFSVKQKSCPSGWYLNCQKVKLSCHSFIQLSIYSFIFFIPYSFEHLCLLCIGIYCLFPIQFEIFLVFKTMCDFLLKPRHFMNNVMSLWVLFIPSIWAGFAYHCSGRGRKDCLITARWV